MPRKLCATEKQYAEKLYKKNLSNKKYIGIKLSKAFLVFFFYVDSDEIIKNDTKNKVTYS